jgi:hypothetical protein
MGVVEMDNGTLCVERRGNDALTTKNTRSSKSLVQQVKVSHAVEQGQYQGLGSDCRSEGIHCPGQVVGLAAQQDESEGLTDILREDRWRRPQRGIPLRTLDDQTVLGEFGRTARADQKCDVPTRLQQPTTKIATDRAGTDHENAHVHS